MKRLLFVAFIALTISLLASGYFYFTLHKIVPQQENQLARTINFLNNDSTNYDVVFIGTSRVYSHIDPHIIDSICGLNSICVSIDGGTIAQDVAMLKMYFVRHKAPKIIFAGLDYSSLQASLLPLHNYPDYYAYLDDSIFGPVIENAIPHFKYKLFFAPYDQFIKYSAKTDYQKYAALTKCLGSHHAFNNLGEEPAWFTQMKYYKGFSGINSKWGAAAETELKNEEWTIPREQHGIELLNDFINTSKQHGSKTIIMFSPMYYVTQKQFGETDKFFETINQIAATQQVPFWNYVNDSICNSKDNFYNAFHLNLTGAEKFSVMVANDINKYRDR